MQELQKNNLTNIAGGMFCGLTSPILIPAEIDVACIYAIINRDFCGAFSLPIWWALMIP